MTINIDGNITQKKTTPKQRNRHRMFKDHELNVPQNLNKQFKCAVMGGNWGHYEKLLKFH